MDSNVTGYQMPERQNSKLLTNPQAQLPAASESQGGSEWIVAAMAEERVWLSFGIPGTHNIELYDAFESHPQMQPVLVTDEQSAAFMADGVFRASGQMAAVNLVPGAGLTHAISGIAECFMDQIPLLVLMSAPRNDIPYRYQLHQIEQHKILEPVAKKVYRPQSHKDLYYQVRQAIRLALKPPYGPVGVEIPAELLLKTGSIGGVDKKSLIPNYPMSMHQGSFNDIITRINNSRRIGLYVGMGCRESSELLPKVADKLDAVVFSTISGKGIYNENDPRFVWNGMGRSLPSELASFDKELDLLIAVGCRFGEVATASYGFQPPEEMIHVDVDPEVLGANFTPSIGLVAEAEQFFSALLESPAVAERQVDEPRLSNLNSAKEKVRSQQIKKAKASPDANNGVAPIFLYQELQECFGEEAIYVADSGNGTFMAMESLQLKYRHSFLAPVDYSCMGYSIPAAIGAKLGAPHRPVIATVGDGAMLMTGLEMLTASHQDLGIIFCILNDGKLSQIAQFQKKSLDREAHTALPGLKLAPLATSVGLEYVAIETQADLKDGLQQARRISTTGKSVIVDVQTDYSVPSYFTGGVLKTNFLRLAWSDRLRLGTRLLKRKLRH